MSQSQKLRSCARCGCELSPKEMIQCHPGRCFVCDRNEQDQIDELDRQFEEE